jgi:hypothetical protein
VLWTLGDNGHDVRNEGVGYVRVKQIGHGVDEKRGRPTAAYWQGQRVVVADNRAKRLAVLRTIGHGI